MGQIIILDKHDKKMAIQEMENLRNSMLGDLEQIKQLLSELTRENNSMIYERAKSYWLPSIENNLAEDSGSFLGSMVNFQDTIKELKEMVESEEDK